MTDVVLQLRSELVEEIEMAETFGEIPQYLLNSFLLSGSNHCCNIDGRFCNSSFSGFSSIQKISQLKGKDQNSGSL